MLIKRDRAETECEIGEEQSGFRQDTGCMDQVFVVNQVSEKYLKNAKDGFWEFWDLEKSYDTIDRHGLKQMLRMCGVVGKLFQAVHSLYMNCRACVQMANDVSQWFPVNVGLKQGSVMHP